MSYKLKHQPCSVYQYADEQIEFWSPEMSSSGGNLHIKKHSICNDFNLINPNLILI